MAKKSSIAKQKKREVLIKRNWEKRTKLKAIAADLTRDDEERHEARRALNKMSPNTSPVRSRNRCQITGRCRAYYRKFKVSRLCFREMASQGLIPGIRKASW